MANARGELWVKRCSVETRLWRKQVAHLSNHFCQASLHMAPRWPSDHPQLTQAVHQSCSNELHVCSCVYTDYLVTQLVIYTNTHSSNSSSFNMWEAVGTQAQYQRWCRFSTRCTEKKVMVESQFWIRFTLQSIKPIFFRLPCLNSAPPAPSQTTGIAKSLRYLSIVFTCFGICEQRDLCFKGEKVLQKKNKI